MPKTRASPLAHLLVIATLFTVLVATHTWATPLFEAPDEVWHYAYVRWLADGNGLPPLDEDRSGAYQEAAQPPLYYLMAALVNRPYDDSNLSELMWHNPGFGYQAQGTAPDNKNMLIHTSAESFPWRGAALAIHATRATSWLFGLIAVVAAWALGREVFESEVLAATVGALVALQPQFVFISSVVSNDSAAAAVATVGLWLAARMLRHGAAWRTTLLAGVAAGLGILTKTSVLPIVPVLILSMGLGELRRSVRRQRARPGRDLIAKVAVFAALVLTIGGWWYARNLALYGDPLGLGSHTQTEWGRQAPVPLIGLLPELPLVWRSFWGAYGWGHVFWPDSLYVILGIATLPLLGIACVRVGRAWLSNIREAHRLPSVIERARARHSWLLPTTLAVLWSGGIALALLRWMQQVEAPHGRLLFPAIGAWALLLTVGIKVVAEWNAAVGHRVRAGLLVLCTALAALAPTHRIIATFSPPRLRSAESVLRDCARPVSLAYGDRIELLCLEASPERVAPGDPVSVRACWRTTAPIAQDYTIYIHLLGPDTQRYAERQTYPGLGTYPTSLWKPGQAFCETYQMRTELWADAPVRTQIEIGLYEAGTGRRLPAATTEGHQIGLPIAGYVDIVSASEGGDSSRAPSRATFGAPSSPLIQLVDAQVPDHAKPGEQIEITLNWVALAPPEQNYVVFVHVRQSDDPEPVAQSDSAPRGGWYPTSAWHRGDEVPDRHLLELPETADSGRYDLWVGLYRPEDGARLQAQGPSGPYPDDMVPLGELVVHH